MHGFLLFGRGTGYTQSCFGILFPIVFLLRVMPPLLALRRVLPRNNHRSVPMRFVSNQLGLVILHLVYIV